MKAKYIKPTTDIIEVAPEMEMLQIIVGSIENDPDKGTDATEPEEVKSRDFTMWEEL